MCQVLKMPQKSLYGHRRFTVFFSNDLHLVFTMKKKNNPDVNMGTFFVPCMSQTTVKPRMPLNTDKDVGGSSEEKSLFVYESPSFEL